MFSNLRQGNKLYILHKTATPYIEVGQVESVSAFNMIGYYAGLPSVPVDVSVRVGEKVTPYQQLPATADTAEVVEKTTGERVTLICSREAASAEVNAMRQASIDAINSVDYHKQRVISCDAMIGQLNPEQAAQAAQQAELNQLKAQMAELMEQNKQLLARVGEEGTLNKKGVPK